MMKSYLRYEPSASFGVISSPTCNVTFDFSGNMAITGGIHDVGVWNLRQATKVSTFVDSGANNNYPFGELGEVTVIARSPDNSTVAIGYSTGDIRVFNYLNNTQISTLRGHRSAVTSLAYDESFDSQGGLLLVSGGADTDIYVWDLVGMTAVSRLRGHHDAVTGVSYLRREGSLSPLVISVSKDAQLKVWDAETNFCIQSLLGHRSEIWSLCILKPNKSGASPIIITGTADEHIRGFRFVSPRNISADETSSTSTALVDSIDDVETVLEACGSVTRPSGSDRISHLSISTGGKMLAAQSSGKVVSFYRIRPINQANAHRKRRLKKANLKTQKNAENAWKETDNDNDNDDDDDDDDDSSSDSDDSDDDSADTEVLQMQDMIELVTTLRCSAKLRGSAFHPIAARTGESEKFMVSLMNNSLEMYKVPTSSNGLSSAELVPAKTMLMDMQGHRSDVRAVALSGDCTSVATCSTDGVKLWSLATNKCIRNCSSNLNSAEIHGTCLAFAPGGRLLVLGTKNGTCDIIDTASGSCIQSVARAHHTEVSNNNDNNKEETGAAIWAVAMKPDGSGFCTGGADKFVKFWNFEGDDETENQNQGDKVRVELDKQLKMESDVLCLCYNHQKSSDKLLVAIGLLDNTVKLFFEDSMKFFLSLYGHKLPVLAVDISNDGKLLVSGSADKTIKVWGLDFGDCHRSLVGHTDSITSIRFQLDTHYFFTGSKDGCLKYWDADR
jgi:U3 small nucleolar RNA-associated protein 12